MTDQPIGRALISVSDKTGLAELGKALAARGVEILSTGGSARALREARVAVVEVADYTGFPEIMDGRVKTLQPKIHGGILAVRGDPEHRQAMETHGIGPIDLVAINLYPFEDTVAGGAGWDECVENIDIGGPALIRAAAKNHDDVTVVTDPADYDDLLAELGANEGGTSAEFRRRMAAKAYARTGAYDAAISNWFAHELHTMFPERMVLAADRREVLRYGENPHQAGAFYVDGSRRPGVATAEQVQGKELSYNNIADADAAFELAAEFDRPTVAIIKHANPCGVASDDSVLDAYTKALAADPVSAFGGIVAVNRPLDGAAAEKIAEIFTEVVIAPDADPDARAAFARKKNLRLLLTGAMPDPMAQWLTLRTVAGGWLVQTRDFKEEAGTHTVVSKRIPSKAEMADMLFAFTVCKHVKSNAIVFARGRVAVGVGAGQMSRVDSVRLAARKAEEFAREAGEPESRAKGAVMASDAFFPFPDALLVGAEAGITAVIHPGGSMRDEEVVQAADEVGLAMVVTGRRHFRH